jgi:hypothetical protein
MSMYEGINQAIRYVRNSLSPCLQTLWRERTIVMIGAAALCVPLLYSLAKRVWNIFFRKEPPHPANIPPIDASYFDELPDDHWRKIFQHNTTSLAIRALSCTCKRFDGLIKNNPDDSTLYLTSVIEQEIAPLIKLYPPMLVSNAHKIVEDVWQCVFSFPLPILTPDPKGPLIPMVHEVLERLAKTIYTTQCTTGYFSYLRLDPVKFRKAKFYLPDADLENEVTPLDQKFLYNLPDTELSANTRGEIEELCRRYALGELPVRRAPTDVRYNWSTCIPSTAFRLTLIYSSCEFFQHYLELFSTAQDVTWDKWIPHLRNLEDHPDFCKKLCILGEHYKRHHHEWTHATQEADLALLLFPVMRALGWEDGSIKDPLPITLETIFLWIPTNTLNLINHFATRLNVHPQIPDQARYAYSYHDLFKFMEYLGNQLPKLQHTLEGAGPTLEFPRGLEDDLMEKEWSDVYPFLCTCGNYFTQYYSQWSPQKKASLFAMICFPAMRLLHWEAAEEKHLPIKPKKPEPLPESTQISFKFAVFSWIPKEYFTREHFLKDNGHRERFLLGPDDHYTYDDLFAFIAHLKKECEAYSLT